MDFALAPDHPDYLPPGDESQECYKRGLIRITNFSKAIWNASGLSPSTDATGELDFGNLDTFSYDGRSWFLAGDWGTIILEGGILSIKLLAECID